MNRQQFFWYKRNIPESQRQRLLKEAKRTLNNQRFTESPGPFGKAGNFLAGNLLGPEEVR